MSSRCLDRGTQDVLCALFYLGALILYRISRETKTAITPALLPRDSVHRCQADGVRSRRCWSCDLYLRRPLSDQWKRPAVAVCGPEFGLRGDHGAHVGYGVIRAARWDVAQNVMMASWNFFWFMGKSLWPVGERLCTGALATAATATVFLALLGVVSLVAGLGWYSWRRACAGARNFSWLRCCRSRAGAHRHPPMVADRFSTSPASGS